MDLNEKRFFYKGTVDKVVDGDTIDVSIDLGFKIITKQRLRFARINAPEVRGIEKEQGKITKQYLIDLLNKHDNIVFIKSNKTGKYGRYIAELFILDNDEFININTLLVENNLAEYID